MTPSRALLTRVAALGLACLGGCAGTPPPDWQMNAQASMQRAMDAQLSGNDRVAGAEFERATAEIARTGRPELMARAELMRCAARIAALQFGPCDGFERLRVDAAAAERAYADYLAGRLDPAARALLPPAQQPLAATDGTSAGDAVMLQGVADPLSRLVGAALWLQAGRASPAVLQVAADTASAQGWRRPLLAWLQLLQRRASDAGDAPEAARLARRIELVLRGPATP